MVLSCALKFRMEMLLLVNETGEEVWIEAATGEDALSFVQDNKRTQKQNRADNEFFMTTKLRLINIRLKIA